MVKGEPREVGVVLPPSPPCASSEPQPRDPLLSFTPRLLARLLDAPRSQTASPSPPLISRWPSAETARLLPNGTSPPLQQQRVLRVGSLPMRLSSSSANGGPAEALPALLTLPAAVLLIDVSGFTRLMESAVRSSAHGLEELAGGMSAYFTSMLDCVEAAGGDLLKIAGDALLVAFCHQPDSALPLLCSRAVDCALRLLQRCDHFNLADRTLRIHIAVTCGATHFIAVGGAVQHVNGASRSALPSSRNSSPQNAPRRFSQPSRDPYAAGERWEFLAVGPAFDELPSAVAESAAGELVATASTINHLAALRSVTTQPIAGSLNCRLLPPAVVTPAAEPAVNGDVGDRAVSEPSAQQLRAPATLGRLSLDNFLMPALLDRLQLAERDGGIGSASLTQVGSSPSHSPTSAPDSSRLLVAGASDGWLAEYRRVTVVFVRLPTPDCSIPASPADGQADALPDWLLAFQALFVRLQHCAVLAGGQVRQLLQDDKVSSTAAPAAPAAASARLTTVCAVLLCIVSFCACGLPGLRVHRLLRAAAAVSRGRRPARSHLRAESA